MNTFLVFSLLTLNCYQQNINNYYSSKHLTEQNTNFGNLIEGTSVDRYGNVYATNYQSQKACIGMIYPKTRMFFWSSNPKSYLNSMVFYNTTHAYIADVNNHSVIKLTINPSNGWYESEEICKDNRILQPNDLTITKDGTLYLSGMDYKTNTGKGDGDLWKCDIQTKKATKLEFMEFDRTNGITLNKNQDILFLSESSNKDGVPIMQKLWGLDLKNNQSRIVVDFSIDDNVNPISNEPDLKEINTDIDGIKTDTLNNLYITRYNIGKVYIYSPTNKEGNQNNKTITNFNNIDYVKTGIIHTNLKYVTNIEFGGIYGNILFIVGGCRNNDKLGCVDKVVFDRKIIGSRYYALANK